MTNFVRNFYIKTPALWQRHFFAKKMKITCYIYNALRNIELKKLSILENDNEYSNVIHKAYKDWTLEDKALVKNKRKEYKLTRLDLIKDVKPIYKFYKGTYSSQMAQSVAKRLWQSFNRYFYGDGKYISEMKYCDSFESESNINGIIFTGNTVKIMKKEFELVIPNDTYTKELLKNKIAYVRIVRLIGKTKDRYYAQVVFQGKLPMKNRKKSIGNVGIDIGTSTVAVSSNSYVYIDELAKDIKDMKKDYRRLDRKIERSRRATNPDNYNPDGTIKTEKQLKWYKSKHYKVLARRKRYLTNKIKRCRKLSHEILANEILSKGNVFHIEKMNFKALQKRANNTELNEKGKFKKKKRFGKSLSIHSPSQFISILKRKASYYNYVIDEVDTAIVKASQYNHITKEYKKKELNERICKIGEYEIQRDLYSAFLLMNTKDNIIQQELCEKSFNHFVMLHDIEIERLKKQKNIACIGY